MKTVMNRKPNTCDECNRPIPKGARMFVETIAFGNGYIKGSLRICEKCILKPEDEEEFWEA